MDTTWMNGASVTSPPRLESNSAQTRLKVVIVILLAAILIVTAGFAAYRFLFAGPVEAAEPVQWPVPQEFNAARAYDYLQQIVDFGPRPSGSENMIAQQKFLEDFFQKQGADVEMQAFDHRHPETGQRIELVNIIARFRPNAKKRYLLCAHYDTRPFPDSDRNNPKGIFVGANDGASGTAGLMEFSHHINTLPASIGVDLVLFDGEELIYDPDRDDYFLGSTYFAKQYLAEINSSKARIPYVAGVLLDMIGDRELQLFYERNSWNYARDVTVEIWATAKRLRIDAFQPRIRHLLRDDHLPLNQIAKIPTTDLIDFDYPRPGFRQQSYWHTTNDTVENCSGESIVAVIYVVHAWLAGKG